MRVAAPPDAASGKLNRERREEALWSEVRPPLSLQIHLSYLGADIIVVLQSRLQGLKYEVQCPGFIPLTFDNLKPMKGINIRQWAIKNHKCDWQPFYT